MMAVPVQISSTILLVIIVGPAIVATLECFQCQSFATDSDSEALAQLKSDSNPLCEKYSPVGSEVVTCPSGNYKCGLVRGTVTLNMLFVKYNVKTVVRDCLAVPEYSSDGCVVDNTQATKMMKSALNVLTSLSGFTVDGNVCTCSGDLCTAGCPENSYNVAGFCLPLWGIIVAGVGVLVLVGACCTCCCCCGCCSCCRKSPRNMGVPHSGVTVVTTSQGPVFETNANGVRGMPNPGFGYHPLTPSVG